MTNLKPDKWIKEHPIGAFLLIALLLCFGSLFPAILLPQTGIFSQLLTFYLARLGAYSPVISAIIVTSICQRDRQRAPFLRRICVFLIAWLIALLVHVADLRLTAPVDVGLPALALLSAPVACLPAYVISSALTGSLDVRHMLSTVVKPRGHYAYYLIALLAFPVIHILGLAITDAFRGNASYPDANAVASLGFIPFITFFSVLLFSGGINEECGWRGFAQTKLQQRYSPLAANLILWIFLVIWHIPNDLIQYQEGGYMMVRIGLYPFITILFGWIYNRTNGSILAPAIFHASMNSMNPLADIFPITIAGNILIIFFALVVVVFDRMWRPIRTSDLETRDVD